MCVEDTTNKGTSIEWCHRDMGVVFSGTCKKTQACRDERISTLLQIHKPTLPFLYSPLTHPTPFDKNQSIQFPNSPFTKWMMDGEVN